MSHTPGPWAWGNFCEEVLAGSKDAMELVGYGPEDSKQMRPIIQILNIGEDGKVASTENGRLIACAPELLEAANMMCAAIAYTPSDIPGALEHDIRAAYDKLRAAIAKAEGSESHAKANG